MTTSPDLQSAVRMIIDGFNERQQRTARLLQIYASMTDGIARDYARIDERTRQTVMDMLAALEPGEGIGDRVQGTDPMTCPLSPVTSSPHEEPDIGEVLRRLRLSGELDKAEAEFK